MIQRENRNFIIAIALTKIQATQQGHPATQQEPAEQLSNTVQGLGRMNEQSLDSSS